MEYSDCCTIISIVPFELNEFKPGVTPNRFPVPASVNGTPQVLVIKPVSYFVPTPSGQISVQEPSANVARAIVADYLNAQLAAEENAHPGIAWVPGEFTVAQILVKFADLIKSLKDKQRNWFRELVKMGDDDWGRYKKHTVISDTQRYACQSLVKEGLIEEREWNFNPDNTPILTNKCPACGTDCAQGIAVCPACKCVLDKEKFAKLQFA